MTIPGAQLVTIAPRATSFTAIHALRVERLEPRADAGTTAAA